MLVAPRTAACGTLAGSHDVQLRAAVGIHTARATPTFPMSPSVTRRRQIVPHYTDISQSAGVHLRLRYNPTRWRSGRLRVLVTGAGGFVGRHLCAHLLSDPDSAVVGTLLSPPADGPPPQSQLRFLQTDLRDPEAVRTLIGEWYKLTVYPGRPHGELFDLMEDPGKVRNRWNDPAYAAMRTDLRLALLEELVLTDRALPRRISHA